jgi:glutaminase
VRERLHSRDVAHCQNPLTNEKLFTEDIVKANLQLMFSAGMYDFSGEWACTVGLPAKSGVGGARARVCMCVVCLRDRRARLA